MQLNSTTRFQERPISGLFSGLFAKRPTEEKYYMFMPGTTTPFFGGDTDTIEYSILQNSGTSKLFGKTSYDDKDVDFALHRDNVYRIEQYVDQQLDFLSVNQDGIGYKATGMIKYKPNDLEEGEVATGTFTVAVTYVSPTAILDVRPLIQDTVLFEDAIPDSISIDSADGKTVIISSYDEGFNIAVEIKDNDGKAVTTFTATPTQPLATEKKGSVKFTKNGTGDNYACAYITISKTGFASWTTTILLESHDSGASTASYSGTYANKS
ncbi:MAG: hypothetical protein NC131_01065 [Roseburia sp.]|nr:hypothetical protein [Roseburia sp.]